MQNKGFVKVFAVLLTLVCVFYLSFSFVTRHYTNKAKEFAKGDVKDYRRLHRSLSSAVSRKPYLNKVKPFAKNS